MEASWNWLCAHREGVSRLHVVMRKVIALHTRLGQFHTLDRPQTTHTTHQYARHRSNTNKVSDFCCDWCDSMPWRITCREKTKSSRTLSRDNHVRVQERPTPRRKSGRTFTASCQWCRYEIRWSDVFVTPQTPTKLCSHWRSLDGHEVTNASMKTHASCSRWETN